MSPVSQHFYRFVLVGRKRTHITIQNGVGVVDSGGVVNLYGLWDWVGMPPRMGPESRSCTFSLGRRVSRKAGNKKKKKLLCSFNIQKFHFISFIRQ